MGLPAGETRGWHHRLRLALRYARTRLDRIVVIRDLTGRPVGVKTAIGGWEFINDLCNAVVRRGFEAAPDFRVIDGGEGGSGATPQALADHMSLPIAEGLPRVADALSD